MSRSLAFWKIRNDVLGATASIPKGCVSTYASIGDHLEIMPRHVSYILATLKEAEKASIPWFRVVAKDGTVSATNKQRQAAQIKLLQGEGHAFSQNRIIGFEDKLHRFPSADAKPLSRTRGPYSDPSTPTLYRRTSS